MTKHLGRKPSSACPIGEREKTCGCVHVQSAKRSSEKCGFAILFVVSAAGNGRVTRSEGAKGAGVAKIIEFYIPSNFRRNEKWISPQNRGKIIEFRLQTRKSA